LHLDNSKDNEIIAPMAIWTPRIDGRQGPLYRRIVDALAEAIAGGALGPGTRLPPHRELAFALGVSANTTARAYAEAEARALVRGEVGRGTFVRPPPPGEPPPGAAPAAPADLRRPPSGPVDLSRNLPWPGAAAGILAKTLTALGRSPALSALADYQTEADLHRHAAAGVDWLDRCGVAATAEEVIVTNGAQHGVFCALMAVTRPGDLLLVEDLTYAPIKAMAERLGLSVRSVSMDEGGLCPDAFDRLCRSHAATALYVTPTLHTPTTITLDGDRRAAVAAVARHHGVLVIEDDVFGRLKPDAPPPIAARAPDCTLYVTSTSKCLAPGLRVGFVRAPAAWAPALRDAVNLTCWMTPPLMAEVAATWIAEGTAERLTESQRGEAARRQDMARAVFAGHSFRADRFGLHLWLALPSDWPADTFRAEAERRGVKVVEGAAFAVDKGLRPKAVRLCLSHEADAARLRHGLETLADILRGTPGRPPLIL
jgi:DNA-binding transcriptional MocR family regulator